MTPVAAARELAQRFGLTPRERFVLVLTARGCKRTELARTMGIAESSVRKHVKHILRKLEEDHMGDVAARIFGEIAAAGARRITDPPVQLASTV